MCQTWACKCLHFCCCHLFSCLYQMKHAVRGLIGALWWQGDISNTHRWIFTRMYWSAYKLISSAVFCVTMSVWMIMWEWGSVCCHRKEKGCSHLLISCPPAMAYWAQTGQSFILLIIFEYQNSCSFVLRKCLSTSLFCSACMCSHIRCVQRLNCSHFCTVLFRNIRWETLTVCVCVSVYVHTHLTDERQCH